MEKKSEELRNKVADNFDKKPAGNIFQDASKKIRKGICPICNQPIGPFKNALSEKEYTISGMCQNCQDKVFGA